MSAAREAPDRAHRIDPESQTSSHSGHVDPAVLHLDPAIVECAERIGAFRATLPDLSSTDAVRRRAAALALSDALAAEFTEPVPEGVELEDIELRGADGTLRARRFRPVAGDDARPTMLWCHGGGFVGGTIDETLNDRLSAALALASGVQILSLEYRLAPEHPYPAAVNDAVAAFHDVRIRADELSVDPERLGLGGNSAGAAIVAVAAQRLRDQNTRVHHQALEVLPASGEPYGRSWDAYSSGFGLDDATEVARLYVGMGDPREAFPLHCDDLHALAPALILVAEHDPLRDGAFAYAASLRSAGVPVVIRVGVGHLHGTPGLTARWDGARVWQRRFAQELATAYLTHLPLPNSRGR